MTPPQRLRRPNRAVFPALPAPEPALQVRSIDDAEDRDHTVGLDEVVHHAVIADPQSVEGVRGPTDGLDRRAGYASGTCDIARESSEGVADALPACVIELLGSPRGRTGEPDLAGAQPRSSSLTVCPFA
jgi:hypothetical protein